MADCAGKGINLACVVYISNVVGTSQIEHANPLQIGRGILLLVKRPLS